MSFIAKLTLSGTDYTILNMDYDIHQPLDAQNRPNGAPRGGLIRMTLESSQKNEMVEWVVSPTMMKTGRITFSKRDASASMKTVDFSDAFCVSYREVYNSEGQNPMQMQLTISAREIKINDSYAVTNHWPGMGGGGGGSSSGGSSASSSGSSSGGGGGYLD